MSEQQKTSARMCEQQRVAEKMTDQQQEVAEITDQQQEVAEMTDRHQIVAEIPDQQQVVEEMPDQQRVVEEMPDQQRAVAETTDQQQAVVEITDQQQAVAEITDHQQQNNATLKFAEQKEVNEEIAGSMEKFNQELPLRVETRSRREILFQRAYDAHELLLEFTRSAQLIREAAKILAELQEATLSRETVQDNPEESARGQMTENSEFPASENAAGCSLASSSTEQQESETVEDLAERSKQSTSL